MGGNKTRDGLDIGKLVRMAQELPGVSLREGSAHRYDLMAPGIRSCPVAVSTHAEYNVAPWLAQVTGYSKRDVYASLRRGKWN